MELTPDVLKDTEMTMEQLQFICTLLENNRPHKIVEVGVAAGGTSVVILDKLNSLNADSEMYSLDLSNDYYRDKGKTTGYLIEQYLNNNKLEKVKHRKMLGDYSVNFLDDIGKGIDFLILDTVHCMPGEILDFLAFLPFLSSDAIVVLHDITLNHLSKSTTSYATQVLLDCVVAEKLTPIVVGQAYPGIGAFKLNSDTTKYIDDVFNALMITWKYLPSECELEMYRAFYSKYYNEKTMLIFDTAVLYNFNTYKVAKDNLLVQFKMMYDFVDELKAKKIYIYGCGFYGQKLKKILQMFEIDFAGFVVSSSQSKEDEILSIDEFAREIYSHDKRIEILIGVNEDKHSEIIAKLKELAIEKFVVPSRDVLALIA